MNTNRNKIVEEYYRDNYDSLVKHVRSRVGESASEDVVQEAFSRSLRFFNSYNPARGSFDTWFRIILTNVVNAYLNAERNGSSYDGTEPEEQEEPDRHFSTSLVDEISKLILTKSPRQSEVLRLYYNLGYTPKQISQVTNEKISAVKDFIKNFTLELKAKYA